MVEYLFMEGIVNGKRGRGRPPRRWPQLITEGMGISTTESRRIVSERETSGNSLRRIVIIRERFQKVITDWCVYPLT